MYAKLNGIAAGPATTTTAAGLAYTGVNVVWILVAGFTLLFAGIALVKLVPKLKRRHKSRK